MNIFGVEFDIQRFANPRQQPRQFLAAEFVSRTADDDAFVFIDIESGVTETPDVRTLRLGVDAGRRRTGNDQ